MGIPRALGFVIQLAVAERHLQPVWQSLRLADVIRECKKRAALTWGVDEDMVEWEDGRLSPVPG